MADDTITASHLHQADNLYRIRFVDLPRFPQGGDMINIDSKAHFDSLLTVHLNSTVFVSHRIAGKHQLMYHTLPAASTNGPLSFLETKI
jgi:hypothetical protein